MNGIDAGTAALLANRLSSLDPVGSRGSAGTAEAGVSALVTGTDALPEALTTVTPQQASTETVLSAVALALDAIIRSGGDATPAVVGNAPVWSDPAAATQSDVFSQPLPGMPGAAAVVEALLAGDAAALAQTQADITADLTGAGAAGGANTAAAGAQGDAAAASTSSAAQTANAGQAAQTTQAAQATQASQSGPVAALATALAQTVSDSGLFYESHLAQWLVGQRTLAGLADEPQNRLVQNSAQLPLDWSRTSDEADDVLWAETLTPGSREPQAGGTTALPGRLASTPNGAGTLASNAALMHTNGELAEALLLPASRDPQATGAAVHAAVIPLVRQQLDLLATGEFRWTGEAWHGVRLDWSIQQDHVESRDPRRGAFGADPADAPWRTRLTLALPSLGTVDAELTLAGTALAVRVQANTNSAARLTAGSEALRSRLEALGLALTGLSIREVGGGAAGPADAAKAANAYARAAAQEAQASKTESPASATAPVTDDLDWDPR
ncbi:flagellar hook-length control protein FliK [Paraburkholderia dinghuensis]|uniref:Flagellar hook-length control protein FliK n=1 Tax=Paraburkholderia dinghuensis TaxID=2305225 RepID=A0A3N6MQR7_9BURK|nr:flagellar hook-length control protein FliK [Paraburkholderia dinghuensis]RQH06009.1 flagellar hook-length control protein FliK [Paraburkholderia dinghuensis]